MDQDEKTSSRCKNVQKLAKLAYKKHAGEINKELVGTGFHLDEELSDREHKVFFNPSTKKVVVSYRGTDMRDRYGILKDVRSDYHILVGSENRDPRFKGALKQFKQASQKYKQEGYSLDTTGHSLGGSLATYVEKKFPKQVNENLSYSRGSGVL